MADYQTKPIVIPILSDAAGVVAGVGRATAEVATFVGKWTGASSVLRGMFERIGHRITDSLINLPIRAFREMEQQLAAAVRKSIEFETALAEVSTLGEYDMRRLRHGIEDLSISIGSDLVGTTKAVYEALSTGIPEENVLSFVSAASKAAVAGLTDVRTSVDALTSIIQAYGLEVRDTTYVSDLFFQTVLLGKTRYEELAGSIGRLAPIAHAAKVSLEEMFAATATLTLVGLDTDEAVTGLRASITSLLQPTEALAGILEGMYGEGAAGRMIDILGERGLTGVLEDFAAAAQTAGISTSNMLVQAFENVRALNAMIALSESTEKFASTLHEMNNAAGATDQAFEKMQNTFEGAWRRMRAAFDTVRTTVLEPFMNVGRDIFNAIADSFAAEGGGGHSPEEIAVLKQLGVDVEAGGGGGAGARVLATLRAWAERTSGRLKAEFDAAMAGDRSFADLIGDWIDQAVAGITDLIARAMPFVVRFAEIFAEALAKAIFAALDRAVSSRAEQFVRGFNDVANPFAWGADWFGGAWGAGGTMPGPADPALVGGYQQWGQIGMAPPLNWTPQAESAPIIIQGIDRSMSELAREVVRERERYRRAVAW